MTSYVSSGGEADTATRLARSFGVDARSWLNLQAAYDLRVAELEKARRIEREIVPAAAWTTAKDQRSTPGFNVATTVTSSNAFTGFARCML